MSGYTRVGTYNDFQQNPSLYEKIQVGDIVDYPGTKVIEGATSDQDVYKDTLLHRGYVIQIDASSRTITVASKFGAGPPGEHEPHDVPSECRSWKITEDEVNWEIWHTDREGGRLLKKANIQPPQGGRSGLNTNAALANFRAKYG